jgi:hypothetical protein
VTRSGRTGYPKGIEHRCERLDGKVVEVDCRVIHSLAEAAAGAVDGNNTAAWEVRQQGDEREAVSGISRNDDDGVARAGLGDAHLDPMAWKQDVADRVRNSVEVVEPFLGGCRGQYARIVVVEGKSDVVKHGV